MKSTIIIVCVSLLVAFATCQDCIYIEGRCAGYCEEGTHGYTTGCGPVMPEATCDNPEPKLDSDEIICDYSACYCDSPTVRDTATKKCVALEDCPKSQTKNNTTTIDQ